MTHLEYALYDLDYNDDEIKNSIEAACNLNVNYISVPFALTKFTKNLVKNTKIIVSNPIDYPLGLMDNKTRNSAVVNAIENGAEKLDIVIQNNYLNTKKYDKIKLDISSNLEICNKHGVLLYYFLEYRTFTHQSLIKACNILLELGVNHIYVSTGNFIDNLEDNIIATVLLKEKTGMNTIFTGNLWHKKQVELLKKNNIDSLRLTTINGIKTLRNVFD